MSSLYDQFFSNINIDHIYNILSDLIIKQYSYDIKIDNRNLDIFKTKMNKIFTNTQQINLNEINKELLTEMINYFQQQQHQQQQQFIQENDKKKEDKDDKDIMDEYNKLMSQRNTLKINYENKDENKDKKIEPNINYENKDEKIESKKKIKKKIIISSKDRINKDSNRFKYKVEYPKSKITELNSLIIPLEDSIHFTNPILKINIEELDLDLLLTCDKILEINNYKYGIYKPEKHTINKKSDILTISIESIYGIEEYESDIINVILNNENNIIELEDLNDFKVNDILILSSIDVVEFSKIKEINKNEIKLDNIINFNKDDKFSVINSNLQNTLIFK